MLIYPEQLKQMKAHGFTDQEIRKVHDHCDAAEKAGNASPKKATVLLNGAYRWSSKTMAEMLDELRPGIWIDNPKKGEHSDECPCCSDKHIMLPSDEPTRDAWTGFSEKVLAHGGRRVIWPGVSPYLEELLARGHLFELFDLGAP
ncbi:hypothetical protein AYO40_00775 [Planctomycetaceae bacterium SCGC AG-212-D15]|nr:hypothetical protein AYO40_00775 [Planctomycetaceae bacterium SCGC AG-212-D15]